jgi:hypothetical protein
VAGLLGLSQLFGTILWMMPLLLPFSMLLLLLLLLLL